MTFPKTRFAPDPNAKPAVKRTKPVDQQCLGVLADGTLCEKTLPYNPGKRLCSNCTKRNADQGRLIAGQCGGGQQARHEQH